jgi:hypothetical protein
LKEWKTQETKNLDYGRDEIGLLNIDYSDLLKLEVDWLKVIGRKDNGESIEILTEKERNIPNFGRKDR